MPSHPFCTRLTIVLAVCLLLVLPFPAQIARAGSIWHEGPDEFANGTMENLNSGPNGLTLLMVNGTDKWTNMTSVIAPSAREGQTMAYDSTRDEMVLFGGLGSNGILGDTWTYNLTTNNWTNRDPPNAPPIREYHSMVYDSTHDEMVLFGGWGSDKYTLGDTWTYNLAINDWTNRKPLNTPSARLFQAMIYDSANDEVILFGGYDENSALNDTWTYNLSNNNWINMHPTISPSARYEHAMAYDSKNGMTELFGGQNSMGSIFSDTWTYDLNTNNWTNQNPTFTPTGRFAHAMVYDNARDEMVLFGGVGVMAGPPPGFDDVINDTWSYDITMNNWTLRNLTIAPLPRAGFAMAFNSAYDEIVLVGGGGRNGTYLFDTWTYGSRNFKNAGIFTSCPYNTGGIAYFGTISWDADTPLNTSLRFQFRSADTKENLTTKDFTGPDGTVNSFYDASGQQINFVNDGSRWFQYRTYFNTNDITITPVLRNVTVRYNLLQSLELLSPVGGENWTGNQLIKWTAHDNDNDTLSFDIYLVSNTGSTLLVRDLSNNTRVWVWDTSAVPNGTYRIIIKAYDDNPLIHLRVNATSGDFTIFHLPLNQPPHVELRAPANNSIVNITTVRLTWFGTDPENAALTYTVFYASHPF